MLHPLTTDEGRVQWVKPASKEAWLESRHTVKMQVLTDILTHHLQADGAHPLSMNPDGCQVLPSPDHSADSSTYSECDRIVVYSAFPSANAIIVDVSNNFDAMQATQTFQSILGVGVIWNQMCRTPRKNACPQTPPCPRRLPEVHSRARTSCPHSIKCWNGWVEPGVCQYFGNGGKFLHCSHFIFLTY